MDNVINGKHVANVVLDTVKVDVLKLAQSGLRAPALAVILVGSNPASQVYVKNKKLACVRVGIESIEYNLPEDTTESELLSIINKLNNDYMVDGILVQLPLPKHLNSKLVIDAISSHKDVDGFHRYNMGSLALNSPIICPCTPHGVIALLDYIEFEYAGKNAVIIGASNIVGRPMALELLNKGCTITVCNSKTKDIKYFTKNADLIVVAIGRPKFINISYINANTVVIDVGINKLVDGSICGDVDFESVKTVAQNVTPVPGGVGPMTIAMLIKNTLECYKNNSNI